MASTETENERQERHRQAEPLIAKYFAGMVGSMDGVAFRDETKLPFPKATILYAVLNTIANCPDRAEAEAFCFLAGALGRFQPGIGDDMLVREPGLAGQLTPDEMQRDIELTAKMLKDSRFAKECCLAALAMNDRLNPPRVGFWKRLTGRDTSSGFVDAAKAILGPA
ncbi:hypothetical protein ACOYW6_07230 [Parablastomonas sp. CN1-191]|uniref:hypothetical protein n=1 Tax=Parablastomonas sp. CN1-191 TaxID=3400908 RepID=UPI003BF7DBE6